MDENDIFKPVSAFQNEAGVQPELPPENTINFPPPAAVMPIVTAPRFLATAMACRTLLLLPDVENPKTTSPAFTNAWACRAKIWSKP